VGVEIATGIGERRHKVVVRARHIVSNGDLVRTFERLLGPDVLGQEAIDKVRSLRATSPCFLTHIGLRDVPIDAVREGSGYHWRSWEPDDVVRDAFKVFIPTMYEPRMAPAGGQVIILQRIMDLQYDEVPDWAQHKAAIECDLVARLEAVIPGISSHIVYRQSASALTSWRFTWNHHGAMLGWEMSPDQLGPSRPSIVGPIANLYLTGHWTQPGGGITPVIVSAVHVASAITGNKPAAGH